MCKKFCTVLVSVVLSVSIAIFPVFAVNESPTQQPAQQTAAVNDVIVGDVIPGMESKAAILMDASSGNFLMEKNSHEKLPIASITKIMTMLIVMEAVDAGKIKLESMVPVSEYSYSMGGSQVYLKPGEEFSVRDMIKAVAIHSANDSSVALAEFLEGSETAFVAKMNEKAKMLGMNDTNFLDCTGLTDEGHYSSAHDVGLMSRELIKKHPNAIEFTKIWMDKFRNGTFDLVNTNKLVKTYNGAIGLKTGFTEKAGYCLSAAATRNKITLVSVVMGLPSDEKRFIESKKILDYGFLNYQEQTITQKGVEAEKAPVKKGIGLEVVGELGQEFKALVKRNQKDKVVRKVKMKEDLVAPIQKGDTIGEASYFIENREIVKLPIVARTQVEKASWMRLFWRMVLGWFGIQY